MSFYYSVFVNSLIQFSKFETWFVWSFLANVLMTVHFLLKSCLHKIVKLKEQFELCKKQLKPYKIKILCTSQAWKFVFSFLLNLHRWSAIILRLDFIYLKLLMTSVESSQEFALNLPTLTNLPKSWNQSSTALRLREKVICKSFHSYL